jgi:hypothetical protein
MNRIGSIEILRLRVYNLDSECHCDTATSVVVQPGRYDLYRDGDMIFWMLKGRLNLRGFHRLGDGLFVLHEGDVESDIEVVIPTKRFGPKEWASLLDEDGFTEGHPEQRIRVLLDAEVSS